jgi:DNA-binding NtrC family response regulator
MQSVLVASQDQQAIKAIRASMGAEYRVEVLSSKETCLAMLRRKRCEFVFIDVEVLCESKRPCNYKAAMQPFWLSYPSIHIVAMSSQEMIREAVKAVKAGAGDYLTYPLSAEEVLLVTESLHESVLMESERDYLRDRFWQTDSLDVVRTTSALMQTVFQKVRSVAPTKSTVLLIGETGTGKGLMARVIHQHSNRKHGPFISVHCGAIPDTLLESELFGHEKGAFTGATRRKLGKFEIANGGTIFLDEVGTISPSAQIKLLEVLQDGTFHRVGGETTIEADVRIIAATNADLEEMCDEGKFRRDLYYRLNVFPIEIPPLRERVSDIPYIMEIILGKLNKTHLQEIYDIHPDVIEAFKLYSWPGNIRELENLMERAYVLEGSSVLTAKGFPDELFAHQTLDLQLRPDLSMSLAAVRRKGVEDIERRYLEELLAQKRGRIKESAEAAGISTRQLHKLLTKYAIKKEAFKTPSP